MCGNALMCLFAAVKNKQTRKKHQQTNNQQKVKQGSNYTGVCEFNYVKMQLLGILVFLGVLCSFQEYFKAFKDE